MTQKLPGSNSICLNCKTDIQGNYCYKCGQPACTRRITFKETTNKFLSIVFAFEEPLWLTIHLLITNQGKLFREYIAGKRKTYYKPVAFFILITAVYLIARALVGFDPLESKFVINDIEELDLVGKFEDYYGEIHLDSCDLTTSLDSIYTCKKKLKGNLNPIILDYRNIRLVEKLVASEQKNIVVLYGAKHLKELKKLLKNEVNYKINIL